MKPIHVALALLPLLSTAQLQAPLDLDLDDAAAAAPMPNHPPLGQLPKMVPPEDRKTAPKDAKDAKDSKDTKDASKSADKPTTVQPGIAITDILGTLRSITTFASFSRLDPIIDSLLGDLSSNATVLAPSNVAIDDLPRKPWEDPRHYSEFGADAYEGDDGQERARNNLRRFVAAHIVPRSPWSADDRAKSLGAVKEVYWVERDGRRFLMPDEVEVERVASQVGNGEVWILKGVLNYA